MVQDISITPDNAAGFKYWAFISYSHADEAWGTWLHKSLERYRVPRALVGRKTSTEKIPRRVFPIFRDRDELPGAARLAEKISQALVQSRFLIVICSPKSAVSRYVNQEIKTFKRLGREDCVLCLIVDGEPGATAKPESGQLEAFPAAVRYQVGSHGELTDLPAEPLAADARRSKDGKKNAKLKLLAGLLDVGYDDLKQRDKKRTYWRRLQLAVFAVVVLTIIGSIWLSGRRATETQRRNVMARQLASQSDLVLKRDKTDIGISLALAVESLRAAVTRDGFREWRDAMKLLIRRPAASIATEGDVLAVAFDPEGLLLATGGDRVQVWNTETREPVWSAIPDDPIQALVFDKQGRWLATGGRDRKVQVLDVSTGKAVAEPIITREVVRSLAFSHDGTYLAIASEEPLVRIVGTKDWKVRRELITSGRALSVAFIPDRAPLLAVAAVGELSLWSVENRKKFYSIERGISPRTVAFGSSGSGETYLFAAGEGRARLFLVPEQVIQKVTDVVVGPVSPLEIDENSSLWLDDLSPTNEVQISGNGMTILFSEKNGIVRLVDMQGTEIARALHENSIFSVTVSYDGQRIATADGRAWLWTEIDSRPSLFHLDLGQPVKQLAASPIGPWIAAATAEDALHMIRIPEANNTMWQESRPTIQLTEVKRLAFSPDGKWLAVIEDRIKAIDVESAETVLDEALDQPATELGFSPSGRFMVIGTYRGPGKPILIFDIFRKMRIASIALDASEGLESVSWSSNEDQIVVSLHRGRVPMSRAWDLSLAPSKIKEIEVPPDSEPVWTASTHSDSLVLPNELFDVRISGNKLDLRDPSTSQIITSLDHGAKINGLALTSDGRWLLSAGENGRINVWPLRIDDIVNDTCSYLARNLTKEEWSQYVGEEEEYRLTCPALGEPR